MKRSSLLVASAALLIPLAAAAQPFMDDSAHLRVRDDLYIAGNQISITEEVRGDLIGAGNSITVTSTVRKSVQVAGQTVDIGAQVGDDVRAAGSRVSLGSRVGGDAILFGSEIHLKRGADVFGDVIANGGAVIVESVLNGNLTINAETVVLNGSVDGNLVVNAQNVYVNGPIFNHARIVAKELTFGPNARVNGNLRHWEEKGGETIAGKVRGTITKDASLKPQIPTQTKEAAGIAAVFLSGMALYALLSTALIVALFVFGTKTFFRDAAKRLNDKPVKSGLVGLAYLVCTPIVAIALCVTIIALPLGIVALLGWIVSLIFLKSLTAVVLARFAEIHWKQKWTNWTAFFAAMGAYIVLKVLDAVPVIGWMLCAVAICCALGAVAMVKWEKMKKII